MNTVPCKSTALADWSYVEYESIGAMLYVTLYCRGKSVENLGPWARYHVECQRYHLLGAQSFCEIVPLFVKQGL